MRETFELTYIKDILSKLKRTEKQRFFENSNLNDREITLLSYRFVNGKSLKECSDILGIEVDSVNKAQLKAIKKLVFYRINNQ